MDSIRQPHGSAAGFSHQDPFSDAHSLPDSPTSVTSSNASISNDPHDPLTPLRNATMTCCRCGTSCNLLSDLDRRTNQQIATCDNCTHAVCQSCSVTGDHVAEFKKHKVQVHPSAVRAAYWHACMSCGRVQNVPVGKVKRGRGSASIDVGSVSCLSCNQKANGSKLLVSIVSAVKEDVLVTGMRETRKMAIISEHHDDTKPQAREKPQRMASANEPLRRRNWSLSQRVKRWASVGSLRSVSS